MMTVRGMRVAVAERRMSMPMVMGLSRIDNVVVEVVVMLVVGVTMLVGKCRVLVHMLMAFAQMQPNAESHHGPCGAELKRDGFAE